MIDFKKLVLRSSEETGGGNSCKLAAYDILDSVFLFGLSVLISLSLAYINYSSLTVTTVSPYNNLIILPMATTLL